MICGYARNGLPDEAISLFCRCKVEGSIVLDEIASISILGVCGTIGSDRMGTQSVGIWMLLKKSLTLCLHMI